MVGEFHSAEGPAAVASHDPRLCGRCRRAAWRTDDTQSIEPSAGNAPARDARCNVSASATVCLDATPYSGVSFNPASPAGSGNRPGALRRCLAPA
ncbi:hypothetical protein XcvCFBP7112P_20800 [Xanthomonas citri pv. vignicola]|nr:hypothetical protein XcvCFBP7112P_20800 [Xanthomonas citri pv. vignicola]ASL02535.1 hypothetical protein XcvCFBP7113P_21310 [Xanthomonas citri pv. vignicola]